MGLAHSPRIVTDGLVLCLDAGNPKSILNKIEVLIVAGGGGGGGYVAAGGGGGGGVITANINIDMQSYAITVGSGGAGGPSNRSTNGLNGENSSAFGLTAIGGGGGGKGWSLAAGNSGGSAGGTGGGDGVSGAEFLAGTSGTSGQGNSGGGGRRCSTNSGTSGGGGGAGSAGTTPDCSPRTAGNGGQGISSSISGTLEFYGGGGGGDSYNTNIAGTGGQGGGGDGNGSNGVNGKGGGGGSAGSLVNPGGAGGSGVVIVRYSGPQRATGGTVTSVNGDTVHTFTTSGTFIPNIVTNFNNQKNGTLINGVGYSSDNKGSFVFDGVNDYCQISSLSFNLYCLSFWMYNNNAVPNNDGAIGGPSNYQSPVNFGLSTYGINLGGWTGGATNEAFHIWSATAGGYMTYNRNAAAVGWHHIAFNWNGTTYDIWLDGAKTTTYAHSNGHAKLANITALRIGGDINNGYYFNGRISVLKCYNTQLTDTQVLQNFNAIKGRYGL